MVGYGPPPGVADRVARFCETPAHHLYQPDEGIPELRAAIGEKLARENGIDPAGREIMVTAGANMGMLNALIAITDPGDEVILPRPYFFNHEMAIRMAGAAPRIVPCRPDHQLDLGAIAAAVGPRTRAGSDHFAQQPERGDLSGGGPPGGERPLRGARPVPPARRGVRVLRA